MTPEQLLASARVLSRRPDAATAGRWPRAGALLARQALEQGLDRYWDAQQPNVLQCRAGKPKLLCLPRYMDPEIAGHAYDTWASLSRACHIRCYELDPTAAELDSLMDEVEGVLQALTQ